MIRNIQEYIITSIQLSADWIAILITLQWRQLLQSIFKHSLHTLACYPCAYIDNIFMHLVSRIMANFT